MEAEGEQNTRISLLKIEGVVRAMATLPGQRTLVLVSPGFLTLSQDSLKLTSQILEEAAHANVVINTLDARGLYVGRADAARETRRRRYRSSRRMGIQCLTSRTPCI